MKDELASEPGDGRVDVVVARRRKRVAVALGAWAVLVGVVAVSGFGSVNDDAVAIVVVLTVVGVAAALGASAAVLAGRPALAAGLLVVSVVAPTWYLYPLLLVPVVGAVFLVRGRDELRAAQP